MFASRKRESEALIEGRHFDLREDSLRKNNIGVFRVFHSQDELPIVSFNLYFITQTFQSFVLVLVERMRLDFHVATCRFAICRFRACIS